MDRSMILASLQSAVELLHNVIYIYIIETDNYPPSSIVL
jgi:hypothetical protein